MRIWRNGCRPNRWDWKVLHGNLTEQFAQVAVVGPQARKVLEKLGGLDASAAVFKFMDLAGGRLPACRCGRSGSRSRAKLSYEIATPACRAVALWDRLIEAAAEFGVTPLRHRGAARDAGREGLHHDRRRDRRTVIPQDLGLDWAISKKKPDFIGKRGHARSHIDGPRAVEAGGPRDLGRVGAARGRLCACRGQDAERAAGDAGAGDLDL